MTVFTKMPITISVVVPVYNAIATLQHCLEAILSSNYPHFELIVVDDGSTDDSLEVARRYTGRVLQPSGNPLGPAHARNRGAEIARGELLFFVDADVVIEPDTLSKIAQTFIQHSDYVATFGSYDENPSNGEFLSQYKNLFHHFVHQQAHEEGGTFWSGCGAIRRKVFLEMGGFDVTRYPRPSIEDIELGYRLRAAGYKIFVNKEVQVKHLKRWTFKGLLKTDILDRAIPWTLLIMRDRNLPNDLNLNTSQRLSALLLVALLLHMSFNAIVNQVWLLPLLTGLAVLLLCSWQWYQGPSVFKMGWRFATMAYLLILSIGGLAVYQEMPQLLPPLVLLSATLFTARFLPHSSGFWKSTYYVSIITWLTIGFGLLFVGYSIWVMVPFLILLLLIVFFNQRLYRFFVKKRGLSFALAAFPFHLLYYFYSLCAFLIAGGIHFWNVSLRSK